MPIHRRGNDRDATKSVPVPPPRPATRNRWCRRSLQRRLAVHRVAPARRGLLACPVAASEYPSACNSLTCSGRRAAASIFGATHLGQCQCRRGQLPRHRSPANGCRPSHPTAFQRIPGRRERHAEAGGLGETQDASVCAATPLAGSLTNCAWEPSAKKPSSRPGAPHLLTNERLRALHHDAGKIPTRESVAAWCRENDPSTFFTSLGFRPAALISYQHLISARPPGSARQRSARLTGRRFYQIVVLS